MSYKAQRACFFYLLSILFSIAAQIAFGYENFDVLGALLAIPGGIAGIIAFLYWIVSVVEAA